MSMTYWVSTLSFLLVSLCCRYATFGILSYLHEIESGPRLKLLSDVTVLNRVSLFAAMIAIVVTVIDARKKNITYKKSWPVIVVATILICLNAVVS